MGNIRGNPYVATIEIPMMRHISIRLSTSHCGFFARYLVDSNVPFLVKFDFQNRYSKSRRSIRKIELISLGWAHTPQRKNVLHLIVREQDIEEVKSSLMLVNLHHATQYRLVKRYCKTPSRSANKNTSTRQKG